jgi:hypothetical protein
VQVNGCEHFNIQGEWIVLKGVTGKPGIVTTHFEAATSMVKSDLTNRAIA